MKCCENEKMKKNEFLAEKIFQLYEQELRQSDAIHRQSERLPVLQTIFFTALYTILPQLLESFSPMKNIIWIFAAATTVVGILSLVFTLLAQWRFRTNDMVDVEAVEAFANEFYDQEKTGFDVDIEYNYTVEVYASSLRERRRINNRRSVLLSVAMYMFMATMVGSLLFVIALCVGR